MSEMFARAELSSWALCPGSIVPLMPDVGDCCTMDPRDKPWDDSIAVATSPSNRGLGWMAAFAAMTEVGGENGRAAIPLFADGVAR